MFEMLFDRTARTVQGIGATGSASFQESSANVGDTIHANFSWTGASYHFTGECYATMYIYDPDNNYVASYIEGASYTGSKTLSAVADTEGTWKAEIKIWNGRRWLSYTDTILVSTPSVASCSVNIRESCVDVGDTIHADFAWSNAMFNPTGGFAHMVIQDPNGNSCSGYIDVTHSDGSRTLSCTADKAGTWTARISVWDLFRWIESTDTISVTEAPTPEGYAVIVSKDVPSEFMPGVAFGILVLVREVNFVSDTLFADIYNRDTGDLLRTLQLPVAGGGTMPFPLLIMLDQTTDFHGRIDVGHLEY